MKAYEEIERLCGAEEFKQLSARLRRIAQQRTKLSSIRFSLPHYVFVLDRGYGATTALTLFSRLLEEERLFRFEGETNMFEWLLDRDAFDSGKGFDALLSRISHTAGFHSGFRGVIGLDIDAWADAMHKPEFDKLLYLAEATRGRILFVFIVGQHGRTNADAIVGRLLPRMPVEKICFERMRAQQLAKCFIGFLEIRGLRAQTDERLERFFARLMETEGFAGLKTLEHLADRTIYGALAADGIDSKMIASDQLMQYLTALEAHMGLCAAPKREKRRMGFEL